jgi:hypothetical protein
VKILIALAITLATISTAHAQYDDWESAEETGGADPLPAGTGAEVGTLEGEPPEEAEPEAIDEGADEAPVVERAGTFTLYGDVSTFIGTFTSTTGMATTELDVFVISPIFAAGWHPSDTIRVDAAIGTAILGYGEYTPVPPGTETVDGGVRLSLSNVLLGAALLFDARESEPSYELGAWVTLPTAPGDSLDLAALSLASGMRGAWDPWLWVVDYLAIVVGGKLALPLSPELTFTGEADAAGIFYAGDSSGETRFAIQGAGEIDYRAGALSLGARLSAVVADDTLPDRKTLQLAAMPFARIHPSDTAWIGAGFLVNILPPYGFSFATGKVWSLRLEAAATF